VRQARLLPSLLPYSLLWSGLAAQIAATVQVAFLEPDILACWQTLDEGTVVGIYASLLSLIQSASIACDYTKAWIPATVQVWRAGLRYFELFEARLSPSIPLVCFFMTAYVYDGAWQWQYTSGPWTSLARRPIKNGPSHFAAYHDYTATRYYTVAPWTTLASRLIKNGHRLRHSDLPHP